MTVLLTHLPSDVRRDRLTTEILLSAYVNKLIKINNENDRWSLVSLSNNKGKISYTLVKNARSMDNSGPSTFELTHLLLENSCHNSGRNLELKFVESMRRQFEFSVDR